MLRQNGLKKGTKITSEPIRKQKDIKAISRLLKWLTKCRPGQIEIQPGGGSKKPGAVVKIIETKTGKENVLVINKSVHKALQFFVQETKPEPEDYLFKSRKGKGHISSQTVGRMVRSWAETINLKGQYGAHTLRKTFGYQQRVAFGAGYAILCKRYNHSSPAITMRYLGIEDREVCDLLMNEVG